MNSTEIENICVAIWAVVSRLEWLAEFGKGVFKGMAMEDLGKDKQEKMTGEEWIVDERGIEEIADEIDEYIDSNEFKQVCQEKLEYIGAIPNEEHAMIIPKTGLRAFIVDLAKQHNVVYNKTPLDELAAVWSRLSDDGDVEPDDVELLVIELKRSGVISGAQMVSLLVKYLREQRSFDKFQAMSLDDLNVLFATLSDYLLSDTFKRRCGIAPGSDGVVRTVNEILFSLAGGELSLSDATEMLGVSDSGQTLRLLSEAGLEMPRLPSGENESQKGE